MTQLDAPPQWPAPAGPLASRPKPTVTRPALAPFRSRALLMALRDLRREPRASWLLVALIVLPVLVATAVGVAASMQRDAALAVFGTADARLELTDVPSAGTGPLVDNPVDAAIRALRRRDGVDLGLASDRAEAAVRELAAAGVPKVVPLLTASLDDGGDLQAIDLDNDLVRGRAFVRAGELADQSGEVTLSRTAAERQRVDLGDTIRIAGTELVVVGIVDDANGLRRDLTVVSFADATLLDAVGGRLDAVDRDGPRTWFYLGGVSGDALRTSTPASNGELLFRDDQSALPRIPATSSSALVSVLALAAAGLVSAAVWQTRLRRRLGRLGLLLVNGADDRQVRMSVRTEAVTIGVAGSIVGVLLGVPVGRVAGPLLLPLVDVAPGALRLTPQLLLLPLVLGIAGSLAAAWWPARQATRVTAQQALVGRLPTKPVPAGSWLAGGVVLLVCVSVLGGARAVGLASVAGVLFLSLVMVTAIGCGALLVLPVVRLLGERLPLSTVSRIAWRDSARQQGRTGAAIAVTAIVLVLPVALGLNHPRNTDTLPELFGAEPPAVVPAADAVLPPVLDPFQSLTVAAATGRLDETQLQTAAAALAARGGIVARTGYVPIDYAAPSRPAEASAADDRALLVAGPLLDILHEGERGLLDAGVVLVPFRVCETIELRDGIVCSDAATRLDQPLVGADFGPPVADALYASFPGIDPFPLADALSGTDLDIVLGSTAGLGRNQEALFPVLVFDGVAGVVALLVIALTLLLTATETDRDLDRLYALGAAPSLRPRVLARQAWLITTLGALVAVALAVLVGRAGLYAFLGGIGWLAVGSVVGVAVVLPALVAGSVRLFARRGALDLAPRMD